MNYLLRSVVVVLRSTYFFHKDMFKDALRERQCLAIKAEKCQFVIMSCAQNPKPPIGRRRKLLVSILKKIGLKIYVVVTV